MDQLLQDLEELRTRLAEAEEALRAIRNGEVDAIVVSGREGERIFSLASAETPYRIVLEEMAEGAVVINSSGNILYCNKSFADLFSIAINRIVGSNILKLVSNADKLKLTRMIEEGLKGRTTGMISHSSKMYKSYLNFSLRPLPPDTEGDICIIVSDITKMQQSQDQLNELIKERTTELEKANEALRNDLLEINKTKGDLEISEKRLRESKEKLELALEIGHIGIWEWDLKTGKVFWDENTGKMLGLTPQTFESAYPEFENSIHEEDLLQFRNNIDLTLKNNQPCETLIRTKLIHRYILIKALLNKSLTGIPVKLIGVCFDATSMKKGTEKVLIKLNEELMRSNMDLQQFAYVASHDLQEPLRMISSFTQLLELRYSDKLDTDGKEFIKFAVDGSKRMYDMINSLLAYSRVQTKGKEFTETDMNNVLEKVQKNLSLKINETKAVVDIEKLPVIFADEDQMIQLFQNLIENSLKFSKGIPQIQVSSKTEIGHHIFQLKDEGIGIDMKYRERIFKIFQRLHERESYEGTGIGLAICKRIVERHGGNIWLESKQGKGSSFFFTIPKNPVSLAQYH